MEYLSTRQVAAKIRSGKLPDSSDGGKVHCACHPEAPALGDTEALKFWSKGDRITCPVSKQLVPALAVHAALGIVIDTRK